MDMLLGVSSKHCPDSYSKLMRSTDSCRSQRWKFSAVSRMTTGGAGEADMVVQLASALFNTTTVADAIEKSEDFMSEGKWKSGRP